MDSFDEKLKRKQVREELRKTHPKAFLRWTEDDDEKLKSLYGGFMSGGAEDFELFLEQTAPKFDRKPNGVRGRLAKYFPDIPGWDYENIQKRDAARKEKVVKEKVESIEESEEEKEPVQPLDLSGNPESQRALQLMESTSQNIFLTGEAGTGKSTLLQYFRKTTEKNVVVLAPTGVAALNVEGQTIHSFCSFGPDITVQKVKKLSPWSGKRKLLQKLHTIVIDEISMVRADLLDCVDKFLRVNGPMDHKPFGGIQVVLIGDLHQLPPVEKDFASNQGMIKEYKSAYFFDSRAFRSTQFTFIALQKIYRQQDPVFINVLNAVRNNTATDEHLNILNRRCNSPENNFKFEKFAIYLTPTNARARQVNNFFLEKNSRELKRYTGRTSGNFGEKAAPTDEILDLKIGAQVMMLNNDAEKRWVNGTMGKIIDIKKGNQEDDESTEEPVYDFSSFESSEDEDEFQFGNHNRDGASTDIIVVELETGRIVEVYPHTWELFKFTYDAKKEQVETDVTGTFTQYPLRLAWAVTIHKAQGKTFDKVYIDIGSGTFAHGQLYVALSRCRTLEGITLRQPIEQKHIIMDNQVVQFLGSFSKEL
jgi:ATP-dependent DNA helicase PIF1